MTEHERSQMASQAIDLWDAVYKTDSKPIWGEAAAFVTENVTRIVAEARAKRILVLPCGDGRNAVPLAPLVEQVVACDASPTAVELAARRLKDFQCDCRIVDIMDTHFADGEFDFVLVWDVLSHLNQPVKAIQEMFRVLRPGGTMVANMYASDDSTAGDRMTRIGEDEFKSEGGIYYHYFNEHSARSLANTSSNSTLHVDHIEWWDEPHPGYRPYRHKHAAFVITLQKAPE